MIQVGVVEVDFLLCLLVYKPCPGADTDTVITPATALTITDLGIVCLMLTITGLMFRATRFTTCRMFGTVTIRRRADTTTISTATISTAT